MTRWSFEQVCDAVMVVIFGYQSLFFFFLPSDFVSENACASPHLAVSIAHVLFRSAWKEVIRLWCEFLFLLPTQPAILKNACTYVPGDCIILFSKFKNTNFFAYFCLFCVLSWAVSALLLVETRFREWH